jgi:PAS domain S-box-containing protein
VNTKGRLAGGDRWAAQESLRLSLQRLQSVSDSVPALISYVDRELRYRMCNLAYTSWFGLNREEIIGKTMPEVLGEAAWRAVQPNIEAALAGESRDFEVEVNYRTGGRRWIHAVYTPQRDSHYEVEGIAVLVTDISARKQAEEKLRASEERFRAFVTTSSAVVYRMSPDWTEMRHLVGRDFIEDTAGPNAGWLDKYIHPEDQPRVMTAIQEAIRSKAAYELEHRVIRLDGTQGWTHSRAIPLMDADGEVVEWFGTATDITERRRAERSLHESEERYRTLFNSIDEGFCVIQMIFDAKQKPIDYLFIEVNPAFEKQTGMHGATGKRMLEFVSDIEPHWLENYGRVALTGEPIRFADEYKSLGSWFDVYAFRIGEPESRKLAVIFNNITKRKAAEDAIRESEERFRNMSNHSPVMLWVTDAGGRCTHLNDRWLEFTGQTAETALNFGWMEAVHQNDRPSAKEAFRVANEKHKAVRLDYRLRRYDGVYRWALDTASPRFAESGEFLGYIGSVIDIQERKEAEIALKAAKDEAERASRAKDHFMAQLSHELRTPLTPVLMTAAELRQDETLPANVREQLGMIERNVALEARLIDDLLDLTRVTRGKLALRTEPCDAHSLLGHVIEMVRDEAEAKRLDISLDLAAGSSILNGDPARLQQVFWNLLRNAVKFTQLGGHVSVRSYDKPWESGEDTAKQLCIEVTDDGVGFATSAAERIFEPFEQGVAANDQRFPGLGLGLAIARAIVDLHGGRISGYSAGLGSGATFTVQLPLADSLVCRGTICQGPVTPAANDSEAEPPMRLLLVEDDQPTLQVLARLLSRAGHYIISATTISAAREEAARQSFDAVISDVGLPDGTGVELMEHLHAEHGLRGIALSGYGMEEDVQRSTRAGFAAHFVKPVDINELRRTLRSLHRDHE